jgi:diguanylate cyclase (GGDEF)-like protein
MNLMSRIPLRQMLTVPYVVLVLLAAAVIGLLSYKAGQDAVNALADQVLSETVNRIAQAVDKHIAGSEAVLETAFPRDFAGPAAIQNELESLRTRFWLATNVHRNPNNYAYYGNRAGQFFGLWRVSETEAELRLRTDPAAPRSFYRLTTLRGEPKNMFTEERVFDPRERPWFQAAQKAPGHVWTDIYIDFKNLELVATRARRVNNAAGDFEGVVATDLSLRHLNDFLRGLKLSANGFAFIVEQDGNLLASSRGPHLRKNGANENTRLNAAHSDDPRIAATFNVVKALTARADEAAGTRTSFFTGHDGAIVQAGYARLRDAAGLNWIVVVAVPRHDFMHKVSDNVQRTVWMAVLAALLIAAIGWAVLSLVSRDLRQLTAAARDVAEGRLKSMLPVNRKDEIGELALSFERMQEHLRTDRLTGIADRATILRRINERIQRQRRQDDNHPFAVLILDLNEFRHINDRFGIELGDQVLIEIARRLQANLRDSDLAARFGGDGFAVFLDNVASIKDARIARDKLEHVLAEPLRSLEQAAPELITFAAGAAIGVALYPEQGHDLQTLLRRADEDMWTRKREREASKHC